MLVEMLLSNDIDNIESSKIGGGLQNRRIWNSNFQLSLFFWLKRIHTKTISFVAEA